MQKIRLIIVEEHPLVRAALARRLQDSERIEVVTAVPDMATAEGALSEGGIDALLVGLKRSRDNGPTSLKQSLAACIRRGVEVIVLVPYADDMERAELLAAGASRYLLKSLGADSLVAEIEGCVARKSAVCGANA